MSERPLLILGAGTFAIEVLEAAEQAGRDIRGFVVSDASFRTERTREGLPVFLADELPAAIDEVLCIGGIVSTRRSSLIEELSARGYRFTSVVHPTAIVSRRASIAEGAFISAGVIVAANTRVGAHVVLNRGANVAHDVQLGDMATVGPGAVIAGGVEVGRRAWIGVGAVIRDHTTIGDGAVVAAGALVVKPVPPHTLVAGSPATPMREGVDGM
jgi:sugar O-acyltransferase (sialic acid O-acetyltransferase NeuD family)